MRACPKCGTEHNRSQAYCAVCHAADMRARRAGKPLTGEARQRDIARSKAGVYLKRGKIVREACAECGEPAEMHHPHGYEGDAAYDVQWLCRTHHLAVHH
jgi:rRNA maturation protein Nop10